MNLLEQKQVIDFLKKKKLSYPLYKEVYDHFSTEIDEQMQNGKGFQEAFLGAKIKWSNELQMVKPDILSFKKIPKIEARMLGSRFKKITAYAFLVAMLTFLWQIIYEPIQVFIIMALSFIVFGIVLYMLSTRKLSFFEYIKLSFHPLILRAILLSLFVFLFSNILAETFWTVKKDISMYIQTSVMAFNIAVQIQLLLLHNKKINVLVS